LKRFSLCRTAVKKTLFAARDHDLGFERAVVQCTTSGFVQKSFAVFQTFPGQNYVFFQTFQGILFIFM